MQEIDTNKPYIQYCYDVLDGKINSDNRDFKK